MSRKWKCHDHTDLYFVTNREGWLYSSAADCAGKKGVLDNNNSRVNMKGTRSYAAKGCALFLRQTGAAYQCVVFIITSRKNRQL